MASKKVRELPVEMLRGVVDPNGLGIETTREGCVMEHPIIAQERAVDSLSFALGIEGLDYNVYVAGPSRADMETLTGIMVKRAAEQGPQPPDVVYVNNFKDAESPRFIKLEKGKGREFKRDMHELIETVQAEIPEVFEGDEYTERKETIGHEYDSLRQGVLRKLQTEVEAEGFTLNVGQTGMMIIPAKDGMPMNEEQIKALGEGEKKELRARSDRLQSRMNDTARKLRELEKERKKRLKELDQELVNYVVQHHVRELKEKYADNARIQSYLDEMKEDIVENLEDFRQKQGVQQFPLPISQPQANFTRYEVNVFVDNAELTGAPVVVESNPTFPNLFGTIERKAQFGALFTDFTMVRPGSLHKANGGYLVIKVLDLLKNYYSYEGLKRVLKSGEVSVEDLGEQLGLFTTRMLKPEPLPLKIKVILIGKSLFYHLLYFYDEDFPRLFKVKAHVDDEVQSSRKQIEDYISFICTVIKREELPHMDKTGMARVIEYGHELASHQEKLSLETSAISDIVKESGYWAKKAGSELIGAEHVEEAIRQKRRRSNLYEERVQELIREDILKIETTGAVVGQINGLSVTDLGDYMFGRPSRITATISLGKEGVVDIEREAELGGSFHTKGVMILTGFLMNKYALDVPLTLSANIAFEQSYSYIDGDSASGAELFALLSAIGGIPLKQSLAVTGALSQRGEIQPIGGVNDKIEGFFDVCNQRGLTGEQGVVIPMTNVKDLMLKKDVIRAVRDGKFHVYSVATADEAMEILTGIKAGNLHKDGTYTKDSCNDMIQRGLKTMFKKVRKLDKMRG